MPPAAIRQGAQGRTIYPTDDAGSPLLPVASSSSAASQARRRRAAAAAAATAASPELLPTWYLFFIAFFFFGCGCSVILISSVLLPAQMATAAALEHVDKSSALGVCAAIGSSTQLLQPPVGAAADACGGRYRRAWLAVGQGICAAGCVYLYFSQSTAGLSVGFAVTMLGSSIGWGVFLCIIPDFVPESQHGQASGIQGFCMILGNIVGSAIGFAQGNGWVRLVWVYVYCAVVNVLVGVFGCMALSARRPPKAATASSSPSTTSGRDTDTSGFFSGFRSAPFAALFTAITISSLGPMFMGTFVQYYLKDRVEPHGFRLFGITLATSAESATAVYSTFSNLASQVIVIPAGHLTARVGGRSVLALGFIVGGASLAPLALTTRFSLVLAFGVLGGAGGGLVAGAMGAISAQVLPSAENSARDMNILQTGPVFGQMALTAGGGVMIAWLGKRFSPSLAWSAMWLVCAAFYVLALPALIPIRPQPKPPPGVARYRALDYRRGY